MTESVIFPDQCRAARALLNWSQADLAERAKVAKQTLADFERGARTPYARTLADIRAALEGAGIQFIAPNGGGAGVRWRENPANTDLPQARATSKADA
ncbi:helix-turn-helix domain-containing protein [Azospirillum sp. B506]|uniref:helix-turn-helix domain-containing protein n=1 Tax=Azospirillum sp. B506 TaxID=137721 RepID=UPI0005B2DA4A|nr:helix-turn-helix transcriptional regulator [Azospirillum sp. B506]